MDEYAHLKNHANRLRDLYGSRMKLTFKTIEMNSPLN